MVSAVLPLAPSPSEPSLLGREPAAVRLLARAAGPEGPERLPSLRPAAAGRRALTARLGALLALVCLAVAVAGCGGDDESSADPPPTAPELTIPETDRAGAPAEHDRDDASRGDDTSGDGRRRTRLPRRPRTPEDTPQNDTPPPADSPAERFEEFCNDNPGACG